MFPITYKEIQRQLDDGEITCSHVQALLVATLEAIHSESQAVRQEAYRTSLILKDVLWSAGYQEIASI